MRTRSLTQIAGAVGGVVVGDDVRVRSVVTDSRLAVSGALFVAIEGERTDGHRFVGDARDRGAGAAVVEASRSQVLPRIEVASTAAALLALAADERRSFSGPVVAITGANGKTSTKDLTAEVLSERFGVHASPGSFNNEVGLPMTMLGAAADADVIVAELGARREGDVALLMEVADPSVVVVTNVGVAHIGVFGSWDAIVRASAEPIDALGPDGVAVLNADDPVVAGSVPRSGARIVTFGRSAGADVHAEDVEVGPDGRASFVLRAGGGRERVTLGVPGEHMVANALAAAAVGLELGVPIEACAAALGRARISHWRMETFEGRGGVRVLNDAYNANPESVAAALKTAKVMAGDGRVVAVLGRMAELGEIAEAEHERIGELAARLRIDRLITVGTEAKTIAVAGVREGVEPDAVASYDDPEGDLVLVKGSRVVGLEALAEALR